MTRVRPSTLGGASLLAVMGLIFTEWKGVRLRMAISSVLLSFGAVDVLF